MSVEVMRPKRAGGMKAAESSTKTLGVPPGGGGESQGHIWGREHKINSIGITGNLPLLNGIKKDVVKGGAV